jgi:SRSO17 transposase
MQLPLVEVAPVVERSAERFREVFRNECEFQHFKNYLTGLIVLDNKSYANIARCLLESADKTNLSRFFSEAPWEEEPLSRERVRWLLAETGPWQQPAEASALVFDDTLCEHVGSLFDHVDRHYDHTDNRYPLAHNLVTSHFVSGAVRVPVGWRLYRRYEEWTRWEEFVQKQFPERTLPKQTKGRNKFRKAVEPELLTDPEFAALHNSFRTKLTLAAQLLAEALEHDVPFSVVLMDGWYLAPELVEALREAEKDWISIVKRNRNVETQSFVLHDETGKPISFPKSQVKLEALIPLLPASSYRSVKVGDQTYWCFGFTARLPSLGKVRLVVSFANKELTGTGVVLATNRVDWDPKTILTTYGWRWPIETFYQDGKQLLGLDTYRMRDAQAIHKHWSLVFLAHGFLHLESLRSSTKKGHKVPGKSIGEVCREQSQALVEKLILFAHEQLARGEEAATVFARLFAKQQPVPA